MFVSVPYRGLILFNDYTWYIAMTNYTVSVPYRGLILFNGIEQKTSSRGNTFRSPIGDLFYLINIVPKERPIRGGGFRPLSGTYFI